MKKSVAYILMVVMMAALASCERRPLYDPQAGNFYVEIITQLDPDDTAPVPELYVVSFYEAGTHLLLQTEYLPAGGGYVNVVPGDYDILVYNFDTEYTQLRNLNELYGMEAFTSTVTTDVSNRFNVVAETLSRYRNGETRSYEENPLVFQPDHLYSYLVKDYHISPFIDDEMVKLTVYPSTILEKYTLTIGPVVNGAYIRNAEVFLTGMASGELVADRKVSSGPANIWFPIAMNEDGTHLFTRFRTFGKFPDNLNHVILHATDVTGNQYDGEWDVTDQVDSGSHDLVVNIEFVITPNPGDGSHPTVTEWEQENTNVVLN